MGTVDHPTINVFTINSCPACGKTLDIPFEWCRSHKRLKKMVESEKKKPTHLYSKDQPKTPVKYYDDDTIRMLESLEDKWWQPVNVIKKFIQKAQVNISRSRTDRTGALDVAVNSPSAIAVKIVSTPVNFQGLKILRRLNWK